MIIYYTNDLLVYSADTYVKKIIRTKHFLSEQNDNFFHIIDKINSKRVP